MKKSHDIPKSCEYCEKNGGKSPSPCRLRCERKGRVFCAAFVYDPLSRVPKPLLIPKKYSDEEFRL